MNPSLEHAYRDTVYWVFADDAYIAFRIDRVNGELDRLLAELGSEQWAYITAFNPHSHQHAHVENVAAQAELVAGIAGRYEYVPGISVAVGGEWPPELSILVLDISESSAGSLGVQFGQNAVVVGRRGEPARLLWCESSAQREPADSP